MAKNLDRIDEYRLADYLAGELSPDDRTAVSAYLAKDASARELLSMAGEALDAAGGDGAPEPRKRRPGVKSRPPFQTPSYRTLVRIIVVLCGLTITFGLVLLAHVVESDRGATVQEGPSIDVNWSPILRSDQFGISWSAVNGAAAYVLIIMEPASEKMLVRLETTSTFVADVFDHPDNETALSARSVPRSGEILDLWISAFDTRGNLMRRSDRISVVASP